MPDFEAVKDEILDSLGEGIFTVNKDFRINFFNKSAEKITGLRKGEVLGKFCKDVLDTEFCHSQCPIAAVLESGKNIYNFRSELQFKNGKRIPIQLNAAILKNGKDEPTGGVISFKDVSDLESIREVLIQFTQFYGIVGHSKPMREIYKLVREIADTDAPVFIQGETGTGKELIANAIQATSTRREEKFVKVNCSVLPPQLLASELFGHAKGAFTGAIKDRIGRFEFADNGTIFLDEVAEISTQMQLQLLRVIQDGTYERLGESTTRKVNVRVIAATNIDIKKSIQERKFREDLYYRLNVIPITVPSLRERIEDVPHLIKHFIHNFVLKYKKPIESIDDDAINLLQKYNFPGNVRELENIIEYAFIRARSKSSICICNLPKYLRENLDCSPDKSANHNNTHLTFTDLIQLLEKHNWNKSKVARILGVNRTTIWRRLQAAEVEK
jgi:PAS domain S-box-containing protein